MYNEIWKPIKDFSTYAISNYGRVKNIRTGRIMHLCETTGGYLQVCLRKDGRYYDKRVHRLVAYAFLPNYYDDFEMDELEVNHIDGDKKNNYADNLEWCTRSENTIHAFKLGLRHAPRMMKVRVVETGEVYNSIRECERATGCNQSEIGHYLNGRRSHVKGLHFERVYD
jgi:hypothetical protein